MSKPYNHINYKNTELGWIPSDWKICKFKDIADSNVKWSITGGPFGSNLKSNEYTNNGVRIIQLQNIGDGVFFNDYKIYTSLKKANELLSCNIYPNDIILSKMGDPVARACLIPKIEDRYVMSSDGIRLVVNHSIFETKFVLYYINFRIFRNIASNKSIGSTRRRIGLSELKELPFALPPLPEQQKIAQILSTWDKAIAQQEQLIAQKRQLKKGMMQQLLTAKLRFPGFEGEWEFQEIEKIFKVTRGNVLSMELIFNNMNKKNSFPVYSSQTKNKGLAGFYSKYLFEDAITWTTDGANAGDVNYRKGKFYCTNVCGVLISENGFANTFIAELINSISKKYVSYVGNPKLMNGVMSKIKIKIPKLKEQQKIAQFLTAMDAEIETLQTQLAHLQTQKQGLMQVLLTGEIRVKV